MNPGIRKPPARYGIIPRKLRTGPPVIGMPRPMRNGGPRDIPGLSYWLDFADASRVDTTSGLITSVRSVVGRGTASQTTAANRPTYTIEGRAGRNVGTFDGTNDFLTTSAIGISQPFTIAWAGIARGPLPGTTFAFPYICDGTTSINRVIIGHGDADTGQAAQNGRVTVYGGGPAGIRSTAADATWNAWGIIVARFNVTTLNARVNGVQVLSGASGGTAIGALTLGNRFQAVEATGYFRGSFGDFLVYSRILGDSECQAVERGLGEKWEIATA